ncbi:sensor histidine kinase [Thermogemmatispora sp.]|uniref:sensor histidine kinase n=1 Tax=Thermogemmatispora sp. TaxID=1968838 RepID=UPI0035E43E70
MTSVNESEEQMAAAVQAEQALRRRLRLFGLQWMIFIVVAQAINVYAALSAHPTYWQEWRAPVIILLSLALIGLFFFHFFHFSASSWIPGRQGWPPTLAYAFSLWGAAYLLCLALTFLDRNLVWSYWILFGLCFALFSIPTLLIPLIVCQLTFFFVSGTLRWPLDTSDLGSLLGFSLLIISSLISAITISLLFSEQGRNVRLLRELAQAHSELEEAHRRLALSAAQEQELAILRERTRLAREMHDTLGHALTLVSVKLEVVRRLVRSDPERCEREIAETLQITRGAMSELRTSIANLRSPVLAHSSLRQAIASLAQRLAERCGWKLELELAPELEHLAGERQEALLKVIQEALTNIEKHAQATQVALRLRAEAGRLLLAIVDNGLGLPPAIEAGLAAPPDGSASAAPPGHYGLLGMRERIHELGGELAICRPTGGGCRLEASIPLIEVPHESDLSGQDSR